MFASMRTMTYSMQKYKSNMFFFFQAEDGIRDGRVTGVQTCALPIVTPGGEKRILLVGHEHLIGRALDGRGDIAAEGRRLGPLDVLDGLVRGVRHRRPERLLDERRLGRQLRLEGEDPGNRGGLLGEV